MMLFVYGWFMRLLAPFLLLKLYARSRKEPLYVEAMAERFGYYNMPATSGCIWIHAVSLGETRAIDSLVKAIRQNYPGVRFVFTHGTATGRKQGVSLLKPGGRFFLRANPGITHKTGPYVEIFNWTFEVVNEFAEKYNLKLETFKRDANERLYFVYTKL